MSISSSAISAILAGTYFSSGTDGEGETNGVPTDSDVEKILLGTYTHKDFEVDDYAPDSDFEEEDIDAILAGTYTSEITDVNYALTISSEDIDKILLGEY